MVVELGERYPLVTIAIPTYNRVGYLEQAIDSVLAQSYKNIELIVSDNHSDDGTKELVEEYCRESSNIKYYRQEKNIGGKLNWLNCIRKANGEYCLILSDDDILEPTAVENMVRAFDDEIVLVIGNVFYIDSYGVRIDKHCNPQGTLKTEEFWKARLLKGYHDTPSAVMYYTELGKRYWEKAGEAESAMDVAVDLFIASDGKVKCIDDIVVNYRVHGGNDTNNIYRCAASHVGFYRLMIKEAPDEKCRQYLADYCENVILSYAVKALRQLDFPLMNKCIKLLNEAFFYSTVKSKLCFIEYFVGHAVIKVWKLLTGGRHR